MGTIKKTLILFLIFALIVIGLLIVSAITVGVWFITRPTQYDFTVNITSPLTSGQPFSNGYIQLQLSLPVGIKVEGNVLVYLDGVEKYSFKMFPLNIQIPTQGLADGYHTVSVVVKSSGNLVGIGEITVLVEDPMLTLVSIGYPLEVYPGKQVTISIEVLGNSAYFEANYSSIFGQTVLSNSSTHIGNILTDTITLPSNLVADDRFHIIQIVVYTTDERSLMVPNIEVFFQIGPNPPFTIEEGIIDCRRFPSTEATNMTNSNLNITLSPGFELAITTGQSVEVRIEIHENSTASEILVGFEGFGKHFIVPVSSLHNQTSTTILYIIMTLPSGSIQSGSLIYMQIRLRDMAGEHGVIVIIPIITSTSQIGTLHVMLTWDREANLDLHVIDPNNEELFHGNPTSSGQNGSLDLVSNTDCLIDGIKTENIYYELAISGRYIVRVDLYSACGITEQINFQVLASGCNATEIVTGSFQPSEADAGNAGAGREVLVFYVQCSRYLVRGTVSYMTSMSMYNPLGSIVRVTDNTGMIYGTSQVELDSTDSRRGVYSVSYQPQDEDSTVYVEFLSSNYKIEVTDHTGDIHVHRVSNGIIPNRGFVAIRDIVIAIPDGAGAFHIMATLTRALPLYLSYGGQVADYPLKADWEYERYAKDSDYPVSYFYDGIISIGGHPTDPDEFDDSVTLHEFGHLIHARTGAVITGFGYHDGSPISPDFAFSEGFSTYLGQKVLGHLVYCDGYCYDLSDLAELEYLDFLGTTAPNNHSSGNISECVVASASFRLDFDNGLGVMMALALTDTNKLLLESNYNRLGSTLAVDFSDMVNIVVCPLPGPALLNASDLLIEYYLPWIDEVNFCL